MSRNKGAGFERKIAKQLSEWTGTTFTRTPSSGGWNKAGDVTPKDPKEMVRFPFNMEMKNNESWNLPMLFKAEKRGTLSGCFKSWWEQCSGDAKKSNRIPVVVFTRNNDPEFCLMSAGTFLKLGLHNQVKICIKVGGYRIFLWDEVLKKPYIEVLKTLKSVRKAKNET